MWPSRLCSGSTNPTWPRSPKARRPSIASRRSSTVTSRTHAPALEPVVGALHLLERDRRGIADHEAALAQVFHLQRRNFRIALGVIVDEIVQIGALVGVDAAHRLAHRAVEGGVG